MTELARMIGQADPFAADPARVPRAAPAVPSSAAPSPADWRDPRAARDQRPGYDDYIAPPEPRDPAADQIVHGAPGSSWPGEARAPQPGDPTYGDFNYIDPRSGTPRYADPRDEEARYGEPHYGDPRYGEPRYDDARYDDARYDKARYDEPRHDENRYGGGRDQSHYGEAGYGDGRPGEVRYSDPYPGDARYGDPPAYGAPGYADPRYGALPRDPQLPEERPFPSEGGGYDEIGLDSRRRAGADSPFAAAVYGAGPDRRPGRDDHHDDRHHDEDYDERPAPRRRGLAVVITVFVLLVIGAAGAFGYRLMFGGSPGPAPVIRADGAPNKVVPATPSTDAAANKQIYDRLADRNQNERVVPREEQPLEIRDATRQSPPRMIVPATSAAPPATPPAVVAPPASAAFAPASVPAAPAAAGGQAGQEPRKVRTVTIRPDQAADAPRAQGRAPAAAAAPGRVGAPGPGDRPLSLTPDGVTVPAPAAPRSPPAPRSAAIAPPPPAAASRAAGSGGWVVQVSAQNSEQEAEASFRALQARYPSQLGGQQPIIRRKDLASGVKYGAQVGPFGSRDQAVQLCESLKAAGGPCFVTRN